MKALSLDKAQISLVLAIGLIGGLTYRFSRVEQITEIHSKRFDSLENKMDQILELKGDFKVLKNEFDNFKKPLLNTQFNVKRVNAKMNQLAKKQADGHVEACSSCKIGPFGMNR